MSEVSEQIYNLKIDYEARAFEALAVLLRIEENAKRSADALENRFAPGMAKAETASKGFSSTVSGSLQNLSNLFGVITNGARTLIGFVKPVVDTTVALAKQGAQLVVTREKYDEMVQSVGDGGKEMLAQMRRITHQTISDQQLMQSAMTLTQLAGEEAFTSLPTLMAIATEQAKKMGIGMDYALDSIIRGVGRASPLILDNLGITVDMEEANKTLAKTLGVTTEALTKEQRTMALLNEIQRKYGADVEKVSNQEMTAAERIQAVDTQLQNARQTIAVAMVPAMEQLLDAGMPLLQDFLQGAVPVITDLIAKFGEWTSKLLANKKAIQEDREELREWLRTSVSEAGGTMSPELEAEARARARDLQTGDRRKGLLSQWNDQRIVAQVKAEAEAKTAIYTDLMNTYEQLIQREQRMRESLASETGDASILALDRAELENVQAQIATLQERIASIGLTSQQAYEEAAAASEAYANTVRDNAQEQYNLIQSIKISADERVRIEQETARLIAEAQAGDADKLVNVRAAQLEAERTILGQRAEMLSEYYTGISDMERVAAEEAQEQERVNAEERKLIESGLYTDLTALASAYQGQAEAMEQAYLQGIQELNEVHAEDALVLEQNREMARAELVAQYQTQIEMARRAGNEREVAQLQSKLNIELVEMGNANAKEDALSDRARKVEEIKRLRAYMTELEQLRLKLNQETVMRLISAAQKENIDHASLVAKIKSLNIELDAQSQVAIATAKIQAAKGKSEWDLAQQVYEASNARIKVLKEEAKERLDIAQGDLAAWSPPPIEIPAAIDLDISTGGLGGAGAQAKPEETVVEALDATVGRIVDIVGNAMDTLEKLVGYESRAEEVKAAAHRLGEDIRELIAALFPYAESFGRDASGNLVTDWRDIPKAVAEFASWASVTIGAYGSALSVLSGLADVVPSDIGPKIAFIADAIRVMISELDKVRATFADASGNWREQPKEAANFAQYATVVIGVVKATADAIRSLENLPQLEDTAATLSRVALVVQEWTRRISDLSIAFDELYQDQGINFKDKVSAFAGMVERAFSALSRVAETILRLVDLPSFAETASVLDDMRLYVERWLQQITDLYLAFVEQYGVSAQNPLVDKVQAFAVMIEKLFTALAKVAEAIRGVEDVPEFETSTVQSYDRLKRFVAHWLRRMMDLSNAFDARYGKEATARLKSFVETVAPLMSMLRDLLQAIRGVEDVPEFETSTVQAYDRLKRFVAHWLRRMMDLSNAFDTRYGKEATARLKAFAQTIQPLFALLGDVLEVMGGIEDVPTFEWSTVYAYDRLKRFVAHWLRRMMDLSNAFDAKYGKEAAARLKTFAASVQSLFALLKDVLAVIRGVEDVPSFESSTVRAYDRLKRFVAHWLRRMMDLSIAFDEKYGKDAAARLKTFAETLQPLISLLKDVIETMHGVEDAPEFEWSTVYAYDRLKRFVAHWLRRMMDLSNAFDDRYGKEAIARLKAFADTVASLMAMLRDLLEIITGIEDTPEFEWSTVYAYDRLKRFVAHWLRRMMDLSNAFDTKYGKEAIARLKAFAETVIPLISMLRDLLDVIRDVEDVPEFEWSTVYAYDRLKRFVAHWLRRMMDLSNAFDEKYGKEAAARLKGFVETVAPLMAMLRDLLQVIRGIEDAPEFETSTVQSYDRLKLYVEHWLNRMMDLSNAFDANYGKKAVARLKEFSATLGPLFSLLKEVLDAIQGVKYAPSFGAGITDAYDRLKLYVEHWLNRMMDLSNAFAVDYGKKAVDRLKPFVEALTALFSLLQQVLDTIGGLRKAPGFDESTVRVFDTLKRYVRHWLNRIADIQEAFELEYGLDMTETLNNFASMLSNSFGALRDVLDLIERLGTVNLRVPTLTFDNLKDVIEKVLARLQLVADQYKTEEGQEILSRITKLAEVLSPIGAALGAITQPFSDLSRMRWIPEPALAALKMNVEAVLTWLLDMAVTLFGGETALGGGLPPIDAEALQDRLDAIKSVAATVSEAITSFHGAVETMFKLGESSGKAAPSQADVDKVGTFISRVYSTLVSLLSPQGLVGQAGSYSALMTSIKQIKAVINGIVEIFDAAINVMDRLLETQIPGTNTIQGFVSAIVSLYTEFGRVLGLMQYDVANFLQGVSWYTTGQNLVQSLIDGIYSMQGSLAQVNNWLWSFVGGMPRAGTSPKAVPVAVPAGDTYNVYQYGVPDAGQGFRKALVAERVFSKLRGR